ncbi:hypothetical protein MsAc7_14710 [Methanolapillus millepedarum]|uniref:Uncharacterized protein n=1 Tax=Methanolapillus millepedarum TaxID=3028296 RepID=A0AA96VCV6_9EURY|nr:hypothetical protein MsAc7_14710 [Methanosarcinaceae archaeon Ac7]
MTDLKSIQHIVTKRLAFLHHMEFHFLIHFLSVLILV